MQVLSDDLCRRLCGPGDQHPPLVPAELQGREALPPGLRPRREAGRRHRALRDRRPRRGPDHRAGRHPRRPQPQPGAAGRRRSRCRGAGAVARGPVARASPGCCSTATAPLSSARSQIMFESLTKRAGRQHTQRRPLRWRLDQVRNTQRLIPAEREGACRSSTSTGSGFGRCRWPPRDPLSGRRLPGRGGRRGAAEDTAAAIAAAHRAFHDGPWPGHVGARTGRPAAAGRRPARARHGRRRPDGVARHRQAPGRERVRRRRRRLGLPPLRPGRRRGRRPDGRHRQPRRGQPDRARADRRLRPDHAVELPAAPGLVEGRALPGRRQHVRAQAERAHPAHRDPPDAAARGGRAARRRRQPRARRRPGGGRAAGRGPAGRPGLLHRRPRRPAARSWPRPRRR